MYMISDHLTNMLQKDTYNEDMNMYCKAHSAWNSLYDHSYHQVVHEHKYPKSV